MNEVTPIQVEFMISSTERELNVYDNKKGVLVVRFLGYFGESFDETHLSDQYRDVHFGHPALGH